jgi:uncharacterized membrane protein (DUF373 family)
VAAGRRPFFQSTPSSTGNRCGANDMTSSRINDRYGEFKQTWRTLSFYERVEQSVALVLTGLIFLIIVVATADLAKEVLLLVWHGLLDPLEQRVFQTIFGQIMTLLIALLALARKFIILDAKEYSAETLFALASLVIALGATYWLVRDRDARAATMG